MFTHETPISIGTTTRGNGRRHGRSSRGGGASQIVGSLERGTQCQRFSPPIATEGNRSNPNLIQQQQRSASSSSSSSAMTNSATDSTSTTNIPSRNDTSAASDHLVVVW